VRVFGKFDDLDVEDIPWCYPSVNTTGGSSTGSGFFSVPKLDSIVNVRFYNGNLYHPEYLNNQHISDDFIDQISDSYEGAHGIIYDTEEDLKLYYTRDDGWMQSYQDSVISIRPDNSIFMEYANGMVMHIKKSMISLGQEDKSSEPATLGDKNADALNAITDEVRSLAQLLVTYATAQTSVVSSLAIHSPLAGALTQMNTEAASILTKIPKIKSIDIPATKSKKVTLD